MSFERLYREIREKIGDEANDLYNKDLLKKIHSYTIDYKWDFEKGVAKEDEVTGDIFQKHHFWTVYISIFCSLQTRF